MSGECLAGFPPGVRDSKLLSPSQRLRLFAPIAGHVLRHAIGHASAAECDAFGMTGAQRLAAVRALEALGVEPDAIIVDGPRDFTGSPGAVCIVGADRLCAVVAAASILAKVTRDRLMIAAAGTHPGYGFERNKGYASARAPPRRRPPRHNPDPPAELVRCTGRAGRRAAATATASAPFGAERL